MRILRVAIVTLLLVSTLALIIYLVAIPQVGIALIVAIIGLPIELITLMDELRGQSTAESSPILTYDQQLRRALIENVRRTWIDGVLKDALRDAQFDIGLKTAPEQAGDSAGYTGYTIPQAKTPQPTGGFLQNLMRLVRHDEQQAPQTIPNNPETIAQVFHDVGGKLLILGEPGSGKSVLLLQLAEKLLDEAEGRDTWPLPVVLNLSIWAVGRKPIHEWVIEELRRSPYGLKKKQAVELVKNKRLIFLLDGLDEVAEAHRRDYLDAVNIFMTAGHKVALCSRTAEYEALKAKLATHNAIEIQPLTPAEAEGYLKQRIPPETITAILDMLRQDNEVWREARKPVFLNILIATYYDRDAVAVTAFIQPVDTTIQQVQHLIIEPYIDRQLQTAPVDDTVRPYTRDETEDCLGWLGWHMQGHEQTTFYVKELHRDWLPGRKWLYDVLRLTIPGLVIGLLFGLLSGLLYGLLFGLFAWHYYGLVGGLGIGLIAWLGIGLFAWLISGLFSVPIAWLVGGPVVGLVSGLFDKLDGTNLPVQRSRINQGSRDNLVAGVVVGLIYGLGAGPDIGLVYGLGVWLVALVVGAFKHITLRIVLWRSGVAPRRFDHFFAYVKDRRLMRQVGGGMIFIHRYILEYFADQYQPTPEEQRTSTPSS
ncbi:MAG: NACHT domain-containing protein [Anaerolineaceae bacterium]|nr:NACHT domain-containing protein [Anaerolineaceae bacterium]